MNIGVSATGFDKVWLDCGEDEMDLTVQMSEDFHGVIYTRGTYYSRDRNCFLDAAGGRRFHMKLPLHQCKIENVKLVSFLHLIRVIIDVHRSLPG